MAIPVELELPLGDNDNTELAAMRLRHLAALPGIEPRTLARLARAFTSLSAVYGASEAQLSKVIGPVAAARIRWFLDAPLPTGLSEPSDFALPKAA